MCRETLIDEPAAESEMNRQRSDVPITLTDTEWDGSALCGGLRCAIERLGELKSESGKLYKVEGTLSRNGGEAVVLLCRAEDGRRVAAKVFSKQLSGSMLRADAMVHEYMRTDEGRRFTLTVEDKGVVEAEGANCRFEITQYVENGDISREGALAFDDLINLITQINEALNSIHQAKILHRDVKPVNIYRLGSRYVLGDFGIAREDNGTSTVFVPGTDGYKAPEICLRISDKNTAVLFTEECDYYSFGITIASLYEGQFVYNGLPKEAQLHAVRSGRIPLRRGDPHRRELENLINGLCGFDPSHRFGYNDVKKWLENHEYAGSGSGGADGWNTPFEVLGAECYDVPSIFEAVTKDLAGWEEGCKLLYDNYFEAFFKPRSTSVARAAQDVNEMYGERGRDKGMAVFLKRIYPEGGIAWRGRVCGSLAELSAAILSGADAPEFYAEMLRQNCVSHWLEHTEAFTCDGETLSLVREIEAYAVEEPEIACYWFAFVFAVEKRFSLCGRTVSDMNELHGAVFSQPQNFYRYKIYELLDDKAKGAQLYGFLFSCGLKAIAEQYFTKMEEKTESEKAVLIFAMLEGFFAAAGVDSSVARYFAESGPAGVSVYIKQMANDGVYLPLNAKGESLLRRIAEYKLPEITSVMQAYNDFSELFTLTDELRRILVNNPICIKTGVYEKHAYGVIPNNLKGIFAYRIYGQTAPLGFNAHIAAEGVS